MKESFDEAVRDRGSRLGHERRCRTGRPAEAGNIVLILADDFAGYGDLQCYGHQRFKTPRIDKMAKEGARLTDFQSSLPLLCPLARRHSDRALPVPQRAGDNPSPDPGHDDLGIPDRELTLGEMFQQAGYRTSCIGKWHLGHKPQFFPQRHGYDEYFGILYSNDMAPVQIYRNDELYQALVFRPEPDEAVYGACAKIHRRQQEPPVLLVPGPRHAA